MNDATQIRAAVVTVTDTRTRANDASGDRLVELLDKNGIAVASRLIVSDELEEIRVKLHELAYVSDFDLILTTGGTGFAPRDNTPEATRAVIEREAPGIAEAMRRETAGKTPTAMLSRGVAGISGTTLIINLPGSPKAVEECFEVIRPVLPHAVDLIRGKTSHDRQKA